MSFGITPVILSKFGKNKNVTMDVLAPICKVLKYDVGDIVEYLETD